MALYVTTGPTYERADFVVGLEYAGELLRNTLVCVRSAKHAPG
jgi:hypothetical protein